MKFKKEDKIEIASALISFLIIMAVMSLAWLVTSCSTHKQTAATATERTEQNTIATSRDSVMERWLHDWLQIHTERADSIVIEFHADSIVTTDGTRLYQPTLTHRTHAPISEQRTMTHDTFTRSSVDTDSIATTETTHTDTSTHTDNHTTAIATPPNTTSIIIGAIVAVVLLAALIVGVWSKRKSTPDDNIT